MTTTEKGARLRAARQYVFEVEKRATKSEVKKEIERLFKVRPIAVNTVSHGGGKRAIVLVREGETIADTEVAKLYEKKVKRATRTRKSPIAGADAHGAEAAQRTP